MRRPLAAILALALSSVLGSAVPQHVHSFAGHAHADHHHGPGSHAHVRAGHRHRTLADGRDDSSAHLESCDPGEHAVSLVFVCVSPEVDDEPLIVPVTAAATLRLRPLVASLAPADVRVHGPPRPTGAPLRAPPSLL